MKYVAAYGLLILGGNMNPTVDDMTKFFRDAGISADTERIRILIDLLKDRKFEDVVAAGNEKIVAMMDAKANANAVVEPKVVDSVAPVDPEPAKLTGTAPDSPTFIINFFPDTDDDY